jgi:hypothetical protein
LPDLGGHRELARARLHRTKHARALEPEPCLGKVFGAGRARRAARAQLDGSFQNLLGPRGIAFAQKHLAEPSVDARVARCAPARGDEEVLCFGEQVGLDVHLGDRDQHGDVARMPLRRQAADLVHQGLPRVVAKGLAESDSGCGARVTLPALNELVDRISH